MGRFKDFIKDGGWGIIVPVCIFVFFVFAVKDCLKDERKKASDYREYRAHKDSVERVERAKQERLLKECNTNREIFFNEFSRYYDIFKSRQELDMWIELYANKGSMELLHYLYSQKYNRFSSDDGAKKMTNYLFAGGPVYYVTCDVCGNEIEYEPD